jgi:hypothetical protein
MIYEKALGISKLASSLSTHTHTHFYVVEGLEELNKQMRI